MARVPVKKSRPEHGSSRSTPDTFIAAPGCSAKSGRNSCAPILISDAGLAIDPLRADTVLTDDDRQLVHHVLGLANYAPHRDAGRGHKFLRHAFAGVAAPALGEGAPGENAAVDFAKLIFVQPRFACALDVAAVVEHEALRVGMAEVFEVCHLQAVPRLPGIEIIDDFVAFRKINELQVEFFTDRINEAKQIHFFLYAAVLVAGPVNKPGDFSVRVGRADLLGANAGGADEISPPMVVWLLFVFLPNHKRRPADQEHIFTISRGGGGLSGDEDNEKKEQREQSFHGQIVGAVFMLKWRFLQPKPGLKPG